MTRPQLAAFDLPTEVAGAEQRDRFFEQFKQEPDRLPTLQVSSRDGGKTHAVSAAVGTAQTIEELGCTVRVLRFFPHYNHDTQTAKPVNLSDKLRNPAAFVEISGVRGTEERWVMARFPDYGASALKKDSLVLTLDCPVEKEQPSADFVLVSGKAQHELWTRFGEEVTSRSLALDEKVAIPACQYTFRVVESLPKARLVEYYVPTTEFKGALTTLEIEYPDADGELVKTWLEMDRVYTLASAIGSLKVRFGRPK